MPGFRPLVSQRRQWRCLCSMAGEEEGKQNPRRLEQHLEVHRSMQHERRNLTTIVPRECPTSVTRAVPWAVMVSWTAERTPVAVLIAKSSRERNKRTRGGTYEAWSSANPLCTFTFEGIPGKRVKSKVSCGTFRSVRSASLSVPRLDAVQEE